MFVNLFSVWDFNTLNDVNLISHFSSNPYGIVSWWMFNDDELPISLFEKNVRRRLRLLKPEQFKRYKDLIHISPVIEYFEEKEFKDLERNLARKEKLVRKIEKLLDGFLNNPEEKPSPEMKKKYSVLISKLRRVEKLIDKIQLNIEDMSKY